MLIFPAIDLLEGEAVRLYQGDYNKKTVYNTDPLEVAMDFKNQGATCIHLVDLEGAKSGETPNIETVLRIKKEAGLFCEIGGGIRDMKTVARYLDSGLDRVIIGTAAVTDKAFLKEVLREYGEKIAVGIDIKDGSVAIKGWTSDSGLDAFSFFGNMVEEGVRTVICTDISKDGAMMGTNRELYKELSGRFGIDITASGGVSSIEDIKALRAMNLYGAIIGKAYYTGAVSLREAIEEAK